MKTKRERHILHKLSQNYSCDFKTLPFEIEKKDHFFTKLNIISWPSRIGIFVSFFGWEKMKTLYNF